jgi:hypothetical protein
MMNGPSERREDYAAYWNWLDGVLDEHDYTMRQLERESDLANAAISRRSRENLKPLESTFKAVERSLGYSIREQMERAGLIEPLNMVLTDAEYHQIFEVLRRLGPDDVSHVMRYLEFQFPNAVAVARKRIAEEASGEVDAEETEVD